MVKLSAKQRMLNYLMKKSGYNTFTTAQARRLFGVQNIAARISELRQEGYAVYLNTYKRGDGTRVNGYRLGSPSKAFRKYFKEIGVRAKSVA
jgi:hypothetical protein